MDEAEGRTIKTGFAQATSITACDEKEGGRFFPPSLLQNGPSSKGRAVTPILVGVLLLLRLDRDSRRNRVGGGRQARKPHFKIASCPKNADRQEGRIFFFPSALLG